MLILASTLASVPAHADCELLYAPPQTRARMLAFHYANELRRARERARVDVANMGHAPQADGGRTSHDRGHTAPARAPTGPR